MTELLSVQKNVSLASYTTLQLGGVADYLVSVTNTEELLAALEFAKAHTQKPPLMLGGGSNVVCSDVGYQGLVIINHMTGYTVQSETEHEVVVTVGAGENLDDIIERTIADGYWGLENLSAIPGSIGATPIQNVGAYGVEISELIVAVSAINHQSLEQKAFTPAECQFSYRDSFFKSEAGRQWFVTDVSYRLYKTPKPVLSYKDLSELTTESHVTQAAIRSHVIDVRTQKFPDWKIVGTAGSFFKNPIIATADYHKLRSHYPELPGFPVHEGETKVSLGWILDKLCGLRGYRRGHVRLYEAQALVLVADSGATATEVEQFAEYIAAVVLEKTGIAIEREVLSV